jgi:hypothetical protein
MNPTQPNNQPHKTHKAQHLDRRGTENTFALIQD